MVSVIIPAREEEYLQKTIDNILTNAEGKIEIIVILDGYVPKPPINQNDRLTLIYHKNSIGQRQAINEAARIAKGKYIMKLDAHCAVDKGFDVKLAADCEYDWTVIPRMYNLDIKTWKPKLHKRTDYMYISSPTDEKPFRATYYNKGQPDNNKEIDDIMVCMGPCFFMHKDRFWELGGCDEGHGGWGQQGIEVALKAWLSGGRLVVNRKTWFAHWFRGGGGPGFPYPIGGKDQEKARQYSQDLWLNNKWDKQTRKFEWLVNKFNPPGWSKMFDNTSYYFSTIKSKRKNEDKFVNWMGYLIVKYPSDLMVYQEIIFENKPDVIIETGTLQGGSALFFANMLDLIGKGEVITIDKYPMENRPIHPRITYLEGGSTSVEVLEKVKELVKDKTIMVSLDSNHARPHVKRELHYYGPMVTKGQYLVVEDTNFKDIKKRTGGPYEALEWYLGKTKDFITVPLEDKWILTQNPKGYLRKI